MSRHIYVDRADGGGFTVRVMSGIRGDRTHRFTDRDQAVAFAERQMGRSGMVVDTTLMSDAQLQEHRSRLERARAFLDRLDKP